MTVAAVGQGNVELVDVLPAIVEALGVTRPGRADQSALVFPPAPRAVVVLIDGLGSHLLRRRSGHAPWLRTLLPTMIEANVGFPSTTATSMGSFGTGLPAGQHGLVGYEVLDPDRGALLNELSWEDGPTPESWQDRPTLFEAAAAAGVVVTRIGPGFFDGSGLTRAALRGGSFVAADSLAERVDATLQAATSAPRTLTYLYWGDVDKVGHIHGCESWQWGDELESVDRELARLADRLPSDCSLTLTADHGMVDVLPERRIDVAHEPDLAAGVRFVAGEPRAPQLYCEPGAASDVRATWATRIGALGRVHLREEVVASGLFGPVRSRVLPRIGDVVIELSADVSVVDSRRMRPQLIALIGVHGANTPQERGIPVIHLPAGG